MANRVTDFAERITELMAELDINQQDICRECNLNKSTISHYVTRKREPRSDKIDIIARAYNVNPAWLMGFDVSKYIEEPIKNANTDLLVDLLYDKDAMFIIEAYRKMTVAERKHLVKYVELMQEMSENNG